jgi:phosphinothricin acetyltransferase
MSLSIRFATPADAPVLADIYAPHVVEDATSFELTPPDPAEFATRIESLQRTHPWLVAEADGETIGYCYGAPHRPRAGYRWCTEVSVYVSPSRHRGRVGRALYAALFDVLTRQRFVHAYAGITLPNPASVAFHAAMGFEEIGVYRGIGYKLGGWHVVAWYSRILAPVSDAPEEPIPLQELRASGGAPGYLDSGAEGLF